MGLHKQTVDELSASQTRLAAPCSPACLLCCAGACHQAVGLHKQAVDDYQSTLEGQGALTPGSSHELVQVRKTCHVLSLTPLARSPVGTGPSLGVNT